MYKFDFPPLQSGFQILKEITKIVILIYFDHSGLQLHFLWTIQFLVWIPFVELFFVQEKYTKKHFLKCIVFGSFCLQGIKLLDR